MALDTSHPQMPLLDDRACDDPWIVRASGRARRLSVRVFATGRVEVVVPKRTSATTVQRFLDRHRDWIEQRRREARRVPPRIDAFPPLMLELRALGESWRVHVAGGRGRLRIAAAGGVLRISGHAAEPRATGDLLRDWIIARARAGFEPTLSQLSAATGLAYRRMQIRRQRTRWGSCSTRGTISLNACLAFQRPEVARYLLIHELAHTRHMNHSALFWSLVASWCPGFAALDAELEQGWRHVPTWMFDS